MDSGNNATSESGQNFILWVIAQLLFVNCKIRRPSGSAVFSFQNIFFLVCMCFLDCWYYVSLNLSTVNDQQGIE